MSDRFVANLAAVAHEAFEEETVLINFERGTYFSLRETAPAIWAAIQTPATREDVVATLQAGYGILPAEAATAVAAMLERLCEEGCALRTETALDERCVPSVAASGAYAPPVMEAFHDLEELISIDPVHEVHEFAGWPHRPPAYAIEK